MSAENQTYCTHVYVASFQQYKAQKLVASCTGNADLLQQSTAPVSLRISTSTAQAGAVTPTSASSPVVVSKRPFSTQQLEQQHYECTEFWYIHVCAVNNSNLNFETHVPEFYYTKAPDATAVGVKFTLAKQALVCFTLNRFIII